METFPRLKYISILLFFDKKNSYWWRNKKFTETAELPVQCGTTREISWNITKQSLELFKMFKFNFWWCDATVDFLLICQIVWNHCENTRNQLKSSKITVNPLKYFEIHSKSWNHLYTKKILIEYNPSISKVTEPLKLTWYLIAIDVMIIVRYLFNVCRCDVNEKLLEIFRWFPRIS